MALRVTQEALEVTEKGSVAATALRVTQEALEAGVKGAPPLRVTQLALEVAVRPPATPRVTQLALEVATAACVLEPQRNSFLLIQPTAFPLPSQGGPQYARFLKLARTYYITAQEFKTGNVHFRLDTEQYTERWQIIYQCLSEADALLLDNHWLSARGQYAGFYLYEPRESLIYTNVHYAADGWKAGKHRRRWSLLREINLIWQSATGSILPASAVDTWDAGTWDSSLFGA